MKIIKFCLICFLSSLFLVGCETHKSVSKSSEVEHLRKKHSDKIDGVWVNEKNKIIVEFTKDGYRQIKPDSYLDVAAKITKESFSYYKVKPVGKSKTLNLKVVDNKMTGMDGVEFTRSKESFDKEKLVLIGNNFVIPQSNIVDNLSNPKPVQATTTPNVNKAPVTQASATPSVNSSITAGQTDSDRALCESIKYGLPVSEDQCLGVYYTMWKNDYQTDQDLIDKLNSGFLTLSTADWSGKDASYGSPGSAGQGIIYFGSNTWNISAEPTYEGMMTFQRIGDHTIRYFYYPSHFRNSPDYDTQDIDAWDDNKPWAQEQVREYMNPPHTMDFYMPNNDILNLMRNAIRQY